MELEKKDGYIYIFNLPDVWVRETNLFDNTRELRQWIQGIVGDAIAREDIIAFVNQYVEAIAEAASNQLPTAAQIDPEVPVYEDYINT